MTDTENENFSYEVFDRQLENFCRMLNVLIEAWDDYSPQELTFDIRSLCIKANRLCHMAEQDMVLQHNDLTKQRKESNEKYEVTLSIVVLDEFTPLMSRVTRCEGLLNIIEKELALAFSLNDRYKKSDDCIKIIGNTLDSICAKTGCTSKCRYKLATHA